jgi:hypothetical protein
VIGTLRPSLFTAPLYLRLDMQHLGHVFSGSTAARSAFTLLTHWEGPHIAVRTLLPRWVRLRRTQYEHMFSASRSNSDITRCSRHFAFAELPPSRKTRQHAGAGQKHHDDPGRHLPNGEEQEACQRERKIAEVCERTRRDGGSEVRINRATSSRAPHLFVLIGCAKIKRFGRLR